MLFLHITTRIPGRKDDGLLTKVGGRGFPTFVAMSSRGEVMAKPRRRTIQAFADALAEAAELEGEITATKPGTGVADGASAAMELLRRIKMGTLTDPTRDRAAYVAARGSLTTAQRVDIERALIVSELMLAQRNYTSAKNGSTAQAQAVLAMFAAKAKLGGEWPMIGVTNRVLINLLDWAERRQDPQLYRAILADFAKMRRKLFDDRKSNVAFIRRHEKRLDRLWQGQPPLSPPRPIRRR